MTRWIEQLLQDARYAVRALRRTSGLAAVVVLTLALGIGMTTAVFSVFNAVVLRPVAYPNPERLVWLSTIQEEDEPDGRRRAAGGFPVSFFRPALAWPGFRPKPIDVYQPVFISPVREGMIGFFNVVGRLEPGATLVQARAELEGIRARIAHEHPNPYRFEDQRKLRVVALHDQLVGGARLALWVLLTAVGFVLLIACANAANLLLARASTRHNEIAICSGVSSSLQCDSPLAE